MCVETMQTLKQRSIKKALPISLLLIVGGIALLILFKCYGLPATLAPKQLTEVPVEELENTFVEARIDYLYDWYMNTEERREGSTASTITDMYYLIDCGPDHCMGLHVPRTLVQDTREMLKQNQNGNYNMVFSVRGTVLPMEGTQLQYYKDALGYDQMSGMQKDRFLLLYIDVDSVYGTNITTSWVMLVVSLALIVWGAVRLARALSGAYQKPLRRKLASMGEPQQMEERFDQFYQSREPVSGLRMDEEFFLYENGPKPTLLRPWEVAWAYQCTTNHYRGVIPTGKSYALRLRLMNGKQVDLSMSEQQVQSALEAMHDTMPGVVLGYSKETEAVYKSNREAFRQRWESVNPGCTSRS